MDLSSLTPDEVLVLANTPAGTPPPGITSDFAHPKSLNYLALPICSVLLGVALVFYLNRMYIKARLMKKWSWDDATLTMAVIVGTMEFASNVWGLRIHAIGVHVWDISILHVLQPRSLYFFYSAFVLQPVALLFLKATFFILYLRLFEHLRWARVSSSIGLAFTLISQLAMCITSFAVARPHSPDPFLKYSRPIGIALGGTNLTLDLAAFIIPLLVVQRLKLSRAKRIGAYLIFLTGGCAIICSILNIYFRSKKTADSTWEATYLVIVAEAELFLGMACACVPTLVFGFRQKDSIYHRTFLSFVPHRIRKDTTLPSFVRPKEETLSTTITPGSDATASNAIEMHSMGSSSRGKTYLRLHDMRANKEAG